MNTQDSAAAGRRRAPGMNAGAIAQVGALLSAIVASACCWLPLLLIAFGVSGGALSAKFQALRPVLLPITFVLLGMAFYFAYRKPKGVPVAGEGGATPPAGDEACCGAPSEAAGSESCCPQEGAKGFTLKKLNKIMLWVVTVLVLAFAFFPNYVGVFLGGGSPVTGAESRDSVAVEIEGMTCEACAAILQKALASVPGVTGAEVSFERKRAVVGIPKGAHVPRDAILKAISDAGYTGRFKD